MNFPKVISVKPTDQHVLLVEFDNEVIKRYDVSPLLDKKPFAELRDPTLFKQVYVEQGGYAVIWNNDIDLSEHELWRHGDLVNDVKN